MKKKKPVPSRRHSKSKAAPKPSPINRKHKDRLFRLVFQDRRDLLDLYNAINGTDYHDPEALEVTTLEDAVFLGVKNDLSFIVGSALNLYEHQSSPCENMPLRGLIYFSTLYQTYVKERDYSLYGSARIPLPFPNYIVFYNGEKDAQDEIEMCLSEAFEQPGGNRLPAVECRVRILNINQGHNQELMQKCRRLWEYAELIGWIRKYQADGMTIRQAVKKAMDTCQKQGILPDLLSRCRTEVRDMLLAEYNEKETMDYIREESRQMGRKEGERIGLAKGEQIGLTKGEQIGQDKGEALLAELLSCLLKDNRYADIQLAANDKKARKRLYKEYGLKKK